MTKTKTKKKKATKEANSSKTPSDRSIATEVRSALRSDSRVSSGACKVSVKSGRATLEGRVSTYRRKKDILDIVEQIKGVKAINDKIKVKPASKAADDDLRGEVLKALRSDPDIPANNISAVVKKGVVTLSGYVPSTPQWERAREAALSVNGILDVKNLLLVDPKIVRSDTEISKDIVRMLYSLDGIDVSSVEIAVVAGQVVLSGKIDSLVSAKRAVKAAAGIRSVKQVVNKLKVK
jgi:osmotically-inducible protein OsmY